MGPCRLTSAYTRSIRPFGSRAVSAVQIWKDAIAAADTFRFDKIGGDRALISRAWLRLKEKGVDPYCKDMLLLKDVELAINTLVEKSRKLDQLEIVLNDLPRRTQRQ